MSKKLPKHFCVAPWVATYVDPTGYVSPCCITRGGVANLNEKSFTDIYSTDMEDLKQQFLNNKKPDLCMNCWTQEKYYDDSYRKNFNKRYAKEIEDILDSKYNKKIYYWDLRPSNKCNLSCLMCWEGLSSGVYQFKKDIGIKNLTESKFIEVKDLNFNDAVKTAKTLVDNATNNEDFHFYFAGGEPLILEYHHDMLLWLYNKKHTNVRLRYNTNCSTLKYKGTDFLKIWNDWDETVVIDASIDSAGKPGEMQRYGSSWSKIKDNLIKLSNADKIDITYNLTTSFLTYENLINTINELEEIDGDGLQERLRFNPLTRPAHWDIRMIPQNMLNTDILDELESRGYDVNNLRSVIVDNYDDFQNHIDEQTPGMTREIMWKEKFEFFDKIKRLKGDDVCDIIPWIKDINYD